MHVAVVVEDANERTAPQSALRRVGWMHLEYGARQIELAENRVDELVRCRAQQREPTFLRYRLIHDRAELHRRELDTAAGGGRKVGAKLHQLGIIAIEAQRRDALAAQLGEADAGEARVVEIDGIREQVVRG